MSRRNNYQFKYLLQISKEMNEHLTYLSSLYGLSKAELIRNAVAKLIAEFKQLAESKKQDE